jgi:hypothetical protein
MTDISIVLSNIRSSREGDQAQLGGEAPEQDAAEGMAEMNNRFHDEGEELYLPRD